MHSNLQLSIKQDQRIALSQQLRQAISLLQHGTLDLRQIVTDLLNENPLLEFDEEILETKHVPQTIETNEYFIQSTTISSRENYTQNTENTWENISASKSLQDYLREQSEGALLTPVEHFIAETLIEAIDDYGRIIMPITEIYQLIAREILVSDDQIEKVLKVIQGFDPVGVGHRDLKECLYLQLAAHKVQDEVNEFAKEIVLNHLEYAANFKKLHSNLKISTEQYAKAMNLIRSLNPKPGLNYGYDEKRIVEPELVVKKKNKKWSVSLVKGILTHIQLNKTYKDIIKKNVESKQSKLYQKIDEAQQLVSGLKHRNQTLLLVAQCIVDAQQEFLEHGPSALRPMNINDVAQAIDVHESTVSRLTNEKYIATPRGIFELKYFFPSAVNAQIGEGNSSISIKEIIKEMIGSEIPGNCLSDTDIVNALTKRDIKIARRTVAKYREALKIPACHLRKIKSIG